MENLTPEQINNLKERLGHWNTMPDLDISKFDDSDFKGFYFILPGYYEENRLQAVIDRMMAMIIYLKLKQESEGSPND